MQFFGSNNPRNWIEFRGKQIMCRAFIWALDWERGSIWHMTRSDRKCDTYNRMIYPLQTILDDYANGKDEIDPVHRKFMEEYGLRYPDNPKLPDCIEGLFVQIEESIGIPLPNVLDRAAEKSEEYVAHDQEVITKQEALYASVDALVADLNMTVPDFTEDPIGGLLFLCTLQKAKTANASFALSEKQTESFEAMASLLIQKIGGGDGAYLSVGLMKSLVSIGVVNETDITRLLHQMNDKRDYEWYVEDCLSSGPLDRTVFTIDSVLAIGLVQMKENIGIR